MLVDKKCLAALKKTGLDLLAESLAVEAEKMGAGIAETKLEFLASGEEATSEYVADLIVRVRKL